VLAALPKWVWTVLILFVLVLWTNHTDGVWVASALWHGAGDVIRGLDHLLSSLRSKSSGS
jgi:hypothetical protein